MTVAQWVIVIANCIAIAANLVTIYFLLQIRGRK